MKNIESKLIVRASLKEHEQFSHFSIEMKTRKAEYKKKERI